MNKKEEISFSENTPFNVYVSNAGNWDIVTHGLAEEHELEGRTHLGAFDLEEMAQNAIDEHRGHSNGKEDLPF